MRRSQCDGTCKNTGCPIDKRNSDDEMETWGAQHAFHGGEICEGSAREDGKGDLKPIKHLSTASKLEEFNVMFKLQETRSFFSKKIDKPAGLSVLEILEDSGSSSTPGTVSQGNMPSTLEKHVKKLLMKTGQQKMKPVRDLSMANKLQEFNVIWKKRRTFSSFFKVEDKPAEFSIFSILEDSGSSSIPETDSSKPIPFQQAGSLETRIEVNVGAATGPEMTVLYKTTELEEVALEFQYVTIPLETWTELQNRKRVEKESWFLQQLRRKNANLYVVTEIMKLTKSTPLHTKGSVEVGGKLSIPQIPYVKGKVQGKRLKVHKEKMDLPEDTVIAYQRKQLVFKEDGWHILYYSEDDEQETFQDFKEGSSFKKEHADFNLLQEEIYKEMKALDSVPRKLRDTLFHSILAMLKDGEDFQNLMDLLEENRSGHLEGHGGTILNELQKNYEDPWAIPVHCILYLLEAIMVLTDIQHDLLAQSMERSILAQERELVKSILQPNFKYPWCIPFTLKPELLASLHDEELDITYGLLEECGLTMDPHNPRSTWDAEAKQPLCSLYGTLSLLQQLVDP
ncbi:gasdermin-C-like [Tenrec ecaudatus]|uniref:gasdermin-C-like n=1 Tax=Tenrec ecaudatus TaxID=94439 RepID=UPI003F5954E4